MLWRVRCVLAWGFRLAGLGAAAALQGKLLAGAQAFPEEFRQAFPLGIVEVAVVGWGLVMLFEVVGRLCSWTKPEVRLPRFRDRGVPCVGKGPQG